MSAFKIFSRFAELLDKAEADLPAINTKLAEALALKADAADIVTAAMMEDFITIPCNGWSGTGTLIAGGAVGFRLRTAGTAGSFSLARANPSAFLSFTSTSGRIDWSKKITISFDIRAGAGSGAGAIRRFQVGRLVTEATSIDLNQMGVGLKIENASVKLETHDGTTLTISDELATVAAATRYRFTIVSSGTGTVQMFMDGSLIGTAMAGPTALGPAISCGINFSVENGADAVVYDMEPMNSVRIHIAQ